jgi:ADP-ribose pyrophosphatase YjhB (NUDIX family)
MTRFPRLGAIAVTIRDGKVLLAQRGKSPDRGLWGFPGGHVEAGETALAAAARELLEETGITADPVEYLTNVDVLRHDADGTVTVHYLLAAVLCDWRCGDNPVAADDAMDAAWFDCATVRAGTLPTSARVIEVLDLALDRLQARRRDSDSR